MKLSALSDDELLSEIQSLLGSQRRLTVRLLGYLSEVEDRRLHLMLACSSMFDFCMSRLRMSEGEAFRRITGARLSRRFPVALSLLENGKIHLSALCVLRRHLTEQNHAELLHCACGKSKREVEALVAARFPKPDVPSAIRKLPERTSSAVSLESGLLPLESADGVTKQGSHEAPSSRPAAVVPRAWIEPLSAARYKVQFTAGPELKQKLERARNLMSHANPSGDLAAIVERGLDLLLAELERKKLGKLNRARPPQPANAEAVTREGKPDTSPLTLTGQRKPTTQTGNPEATTQTGNPEATLLTDQPEATTLTGKPETTTLTGKPETTTLTGKPETITETKQGATQRGQNQRAVTRVTKRRASARASRRRAITRAAWREVFERDGERCTFVDSEGRRCPARAFLEIDHAEASARGGSDEAENLRVRCQAHNQLSAEQTFGRAHIKQRIYLRQRKSRPQTTDISRRS